MGTSRSRRAGSCGSSSKTNGKAFAGVKLGETLRQRFSFREHPRWLRFLSFTLGPVLQAPSPRSCRERPGLGARSECPDGLVTASAIQTQTGMYSSVPCRGRQSDGKTAVSPQTHLAREGRAQGPGAGQHEHRPYRGPSPPAAETGAPYEGDVSGPPRSSDITPGPQKPQNTPERQAGDGRDPGAHGGKDAPFVTQGTPQRHHPVRTPGPQWHEPVWDHGITFPVN